MGVVLKLEHPQEPAAASFGSVFDEAAEIRLIFDAGVDLDVEVSTAWREGEPPPFDPVRCLVWGGVVLTGLLFWSAVLVLFRSVL